MAPHSSTLAWKIPWTEEPSRAAVHGVTEGRTRLSDFTFTFYFHALEKEMATHSSVLAWRISGTGSLVGCRLWDRTESNTTEVTQQQQQQIIVLTSTLWIQSGFFNKVLGNLTSHSRKNIKIDIYSLPKYIRFFKL